MTDTHLDTPRAVIVAGLLGSVVSLKFVDTLGVQQRGAAVISGTAMAHYVAPLISHIYNEENYIQTIGFLIGLFGMSITAAIFRGIQSSDLWNFIMSRWGKKNDQSGSGE